MLTKIISHRDHLHLCFSEIGSFMYISMKMKVSTKSVQYFRTLQKLLTEMVAVQAEHKHILFYLC